jgi:pyroglutamyl-peptidase
MKTLITAFEPFNNEARNSSLEVLKALSVKSELITEVLPVVKSKSISQLKTVIKKHNPDIVIALGQAKGRAEISLERIAINIDDYRIEDNEGNQPIDEKIIKKGESAYFSTLPIKVISKKLSEHKILNSISNTAGTFVCNHLFYGLMHMIKDSKVRAGFIHLPILPEQKTSKEEVAMELSVMVNAMNLIIQATIENKYDIKVSAGKIC